ncbi:MAG: hypothetical protein AB8I08_16475 [Sandaracinaceae bacterium]
MRPSRVLPYLLVLAVLPLSSSCDSDPVEPDAGGVETMGCGRGIPYPPMTWWMPAIGTSPGASREVWVELERDCLLDLELTVTASVDGIVDVPATLSIPAGSARATFTISGVAVGETVLTASAEHESGDTVSADVDIAVVEGDVAACDGEASGMLQPGGSVQVSAGTLTGAGLALQEGAARDNRYQIDPFEVTVGCAEDLTPEGYITLGQAVTFGPEHARLAREIPIIVPIQLARLPEGAHRGHVAFVYRGPNETEGRIVPVASPWFQGPAGQGGTVTFEASRLGTYQAVVRSDAPTTRERRFTFRGILGFSMGGSGSGRIGFGNPDRFDFVAPLGGPTDWTYMLEHMRSYHMGGFCTEEQRVADPAACEAGASLDYVPPTSYLHEHPQHYEHWWYEDGYEGQGGTFNRTDYISIMRDLASMFGNPNYDSSLDESEPDITPPGVADSRRAQSNTIRCMETVTIPPDDGTAGTGFFDDEYNPTGSYPVISFCDGAETGDIGDWNPEGGQSMPIEILVAVDINENGRRDPGEPVIRNGREPWDDFGLDGVRNEDETSADGTPYDAVENPDPAGDDFDFQYNPTGTENNHRRDTVDDDPCRAGEAGMAEAFLDAGLDGVIGTRQLDAGGYDSGEGDGCHNLARGAARMIESSPRYQVERMDAETLANTDLFADGGIRDLFNWVVMGNVTTAGWAARGLPVRFFNGHASLHMDGRGDLDYFRVPWEEVGHATMVRYGDPDIDDRFLEAGDGGHVGTNSQLIDRLRAGLKVMDTRWPDGNRDRVVGDRVCARLSSDCENVNQFSFDFTSTAGRTGPVSVVLPPGYFEDGAEDPGYPVVYFLHGYGMQPEDLLALGLLMWEAMNSPRIGTERRLQKMILVFPDGRCRDDECLRGTFYTDAPESNPDGAQMQTFLLDLMDHMDANYNTRGTETFTVTE